jgi:hypothetical protein
LANCNFFRNIIDLEQILRKIIEVISLSQSSRPLRYGREIMDLAHHLKWLTLVTVMHMILTDKYIMNTVIIDGSKGCKFMVLFSLYSPW